MGMKSSITNEEVRRRVDNVRNLGVDVYFDGVYVNAKTPIEVYCSKGHRWKTKLGNITHNHQGCPFCSGLRPIVGETDLWTTMPSIAALLLNPEHGYELTSGSNKHVDFICPNCGTISNRALNNICKRGFSCPVCSDGISYPNKFMASVLEQLKVDYTPEYIIEGGSYRYDFYLHKYNTVIEMHGRQHYEGFGEAKRQSLEEIQKNDVDKMNFAIDKNVEHYIVVDSKCSDINYISRNIKNSYLSTLFELSDIDWVQCGFYASGSLVYKSAELYNSGYDVKLIAEKLKVSPSSIHHWLNKATELGLCCWIKSSGFLNPTHAVVLLNTHEKFDSISDASRKYNVAVANISKNCQKDRTYAGTHPETGEPMVWRYIEDYNSGETIHFMSLVNPRAKKIINE